MPTLIISIILAAVVFLAARSVWKGRKKGCGCNCGGCDGCGYNTSCESSLE